MFSIRWNGTSQTRFLLAGYQTDHILQGINKTVMIKSLNDIPQDVTVFFAGTLERINKQNDVRKSLAFSALKWVSAATRPIYVDELRKALSVESGYNIEIEMYSRKSLESVCTGLVIIEGRSPCRLAHYTVLEYIRKHHPDLLLEAHSFVARTCLECLKCLIPATNIVGRIYLTIPGEHKSLYFYAVSNWATHLKSAREP